MTKEKTLLLQLVALVLLASSAVATDDLQRQIVIEQAEQKLEDNYILSRVLYTKSIETGKSTVTSLKKNLRFIRRLEKDPAFRQCIAWQDAIRLSDKTAQRAKYLLDRKKISRSGYQKLLSELKSEKEKLSKKMHARSCEEEK